MSKVAGLTINYTSNIELTLSGNKVSLEAAKALLTVRNKSISQQIKQLQKSQPKSPRHQANIRYKLAELQSKEVHELYAENPDGTLSVPPGFWYLGDMRGSQHRSEISPHLVGDERYYQKEIVEELLKYKRSCIVAATGTGKSRIIRDLVLSYVKAEKRVLVCVPSVELLSQTAETVDAGLSGGGFAKSGKLGHGKKPKEGLGCVISTIQSAQNIVDMFDVVIFDELHVIAAESYQKVAAGAVNAEYVHGLTATIHRPDGLTPLIHAWCGKTVYEYSYRKAVEDGFLSPIHYFPKRLVSSARTHGQMHNTKEYIALHSDVSFIDKLEPIVRNSLNAGRKTLVLFKFSECCDALAERFNVTAASGSYRKPLESFKNGETQLLIGNTALLSTGLDIPDISSIIFCAAGTSEIVFMQSMGRGTRLAQGKKDCIVVDVTVDNYKYVQQGKVRTDLAIRAGYEVKTS